MKIAFVTKQDSDKPLEIEEIREIFENSDNLKKIKEAVEQGKDRVYTTWASVEVKDKAGELIPIDGLAEQQEILLKRHGPISDMHTNAIIGETLAYKVIEHPKSKTMGILHLNRIYDDNDLDDKVWKEIVSGERTGSSVGGINEGLSLGMIEETGEEVKVLEGFKQYETASVFDPCNPLSLNESISIIAKSNHVKKPKEVTKNIANDINKEELIDIDNLKGDIMKEKIEKQEEKPDEEKPKEKEPVEEKKKEETVEPEEEKQEDPEVVPIEEKKKEEVASEIEGENTATQPEEPVEEQSNDEDAFIQKIEGKLDKKFDELRKELVSKSSTPRPGTMPVNKAEEEYSKLPLDIATGAKKMNMLEVHKAYNNQVDRMEGSD